MNSPRTPAVALVLAIAGVALVVGAGLLFFIDNDPAWLFGDPLLSTIMALAGLGLGYAAWARSRRGADEEA